MDVLSNITLIILKSLSRGGLLNLRREREQADFWVERCRIKTRKTLSQSRISAQKICSPFYTPRGRRELQRA